MDFRSDPLLGLGVRRYYDLDGSGVSCLLLDLPGFNSLFVCFFFFCFFLFFFLFVCLFVFFVLFFFLLQIFSMLFGAQGSPSPGSLLQF